MNNEIIIKAAKLNQQLKEVLEEQEAVNQEFVPLASMIVKSYRDKTLSSNEELLQDFEELERAQKVLRSKCDALISASTALMVQTQMGQEGEQEYLRVKEMFNEEDEKTEIFRFDLNLKNVGMMCVAVVLVLLIAVEINKIF